MRGMGRVETVGLVSAWALEDLGQVWEEALGEAHSPISDSCGDPHYEMLMLEPPRSHPLQPLGSACLGASLTFGF